MNLKIITPFNIILEQKALLVTLPGEEGEFGVLPSHALLIAALKPGVIKIYTDNYQHYNLLYFVQDGLAEITGQTVTIATEFALDCTKLEKITILEKIALLKEQDLSSIQYETLLQVIY